MLHSRDSVFVQMDAVPHRMGELLDIAERVVVTRGGDEERAGLGLPGPVLERWAKRAVCGRVDVSDGPTTPVSGSRLSGPSSSACCDENASAYALKMPRVCFWYASRTARAL